MAQLSLQGWGLAVSLGCPIPSCSPQHHLGKVSQGLSLLGMNLGVKDTQHGACSIPKHGMSQGRGGTRRARGASAAPSLPVTPLLGKQGCHLFPAFLPAAPSCPLSQCSSSSTRCPCRVQGFAAFPGTTAPLPLVPEPYNPLIPLDRGIPAGLDFTKSQIWFLDVPVTILQGWG